MCVCVCWGGHQCTQSHQLPRPFSPHPLHQFDAGWSNSQICGGGPSPGPTPTPAPSPGPPPPGPSPGPSPPKSKFLPSLAASARLSLTCLLFPLAVLASTAGKSKKKTPVGWILVGLFLGCMTVYFVGGFVFLKVCLPLCICVHGAGRRRDRQDSPTTSGLSPCSTSAVPRARRPFRTWSSGPRFPVSVGRERKKNSPARST